LSEAVSNNADLSSSSPGAVLRRCREYHGISLEEAAEATKMGKNYLIALENDNSKEFASQAYLKGFLRIYTNYLGLNPDDMLRLYDKYANGSDTKPAEPRIGTGTVPPKRRMSFKKFAIPAFLLLLIVITAGILNRSNAPPKREQTPPQTAEQKPAQAIQPVHSSAHIPPPYQKPESKSAPVERPADAQPADQNGGQSQPAETARSFIVRMKVNQNGTLNVTIDGAVSQKYELTAGDAIEWKAEKQIALDLSNAGGVEVELNGKPLKPLGLAGKPVFIVLDADGVRP
jgi:cytoskeleton protein RodZ